MEVTRPPVHREAVEGVHRSRSARSRSHIEAAKLALAQLPKKCRRGRNTLIRCDSGGGTHEFVAWLAQRGRWLSYSVGMTITDAIHQAVLQSPATAWTPAVEPDGAVHDGAWVAEIDAGSSRAAGRPKGIRLIVRKERPHPGAQLRFTDADGMRLTCFATNTKHTPIAELELRHRQRARAEDRIRAARATGLRNLPLHDTAQNQVWLEIVQIALDLLAWMPMPALARDSRLWGAPPHATAAVLHRRPARHHRTPPHPSPRGPLAVDGCDHMCPRTAGCTPEPRMTSSDPVPMSLNELPEPWNPAPTRRDSRAISMPHTGPERRHRPGRDRPGRHPRSDDHRLPAQPAHRLHLHLVGMSGVQLGEHQRFIFRWAFGTALVMTAVALLTGAISL